MSFIANEPLPCSYCSRLVSDYTLFADGSVRCAGCRQRDEERYARMTVPSEKDWLWQRNEAGDR